MARARDLILNPGDFRFGDEGTRMHTLLGSCVSITVWHPRLRVGGMCHYMLPSRPGQATASGSHELDGRFADDAVRMFLWEVNSRGTRPDEYEVKMFGGGNQFPGARVAPGFDVAHDNIAAGESLLSGNGFTLIGGQVGGTGPYRLLFDLSTGVVWLNCPQPAPATPAAGRRLFPAQRTAPTAVPPTAVPPSTSLFRLAMPTGSPA